jgi:hypothetical protein
VVFGRPDHWPHPYHGCALPTELGGQVTVLQLGDDIVAAMPMKRPINRALISIQRRRCYRITPASTQQHPPHQLPCAVHRPRSRHLTPSASRPDPPPPRPSDEVGLAPGLTVWVPSSGSGLTVWVPSSGSAGLPSPLRQMTGWLALGWSSAASPLPSVVPQGIERILSPLGHLSNASQHPNLLVRSLHQDDFFRAK